MAQQTRTANRIPDAHASSVALPVVPAVCASLALLSNVVMAELNRLVADVLDGTGTSWSFADVFGPARALSPGGGVAVWRAWESLGGIPPTSSGPSPAAQVSDLLGLHLVADLVFVAAYAVLGGVLLRRSRLTLQLLRALVVIDLLEDAVAGLIGLRIRHAVARPGWPEQSIGWLTAVKWALAVAVAVSAVLVAAGWARAVRRQLIDADGATRQLPAPMPGAGTAEPTVAPLRRALQALWLQRFSLIALVPLGVLATGPGNEPLDQLPDVARSWVDDGAGRWYLAWATAGLALLVPALFVLGRLRSDRVWRERVPAAASAVRAVPGRAPERADDEGARLPDWLALARRGPDWLRTALPVGAWQGTGARPAAAGRVPALQPPAPQLWLLVAALVAGSALVASLLGARVGWWPSLVWVLIAVGVLGLSVPAGMSRRGRRLPMYAADPALARTTVMVGDVASLSAVAVAGAGLARAFTAPAAVDGSGSAWLLLVLGTVAAVGVWPVGERARARLAQRPRVGSARPLRWASQVLAPGKGLDMATFAGRGMTRGMRSRRRLRAGLALLAAGSLLGLGLAPVRWAHTIGVLACAEFAVTALVLLFGVLVVVSRDHLPLPLFRWLGLRSTPLVTLMVLGAVLVSIQTGDPGLHGVHGLGAPAALSPQARPELPQVFDQWLRDSADCDRRVTLSDGRRIRVRPMLLVAADGGGIRAAYWTVSALAAVRQLGGRCGARATLLSSGVSGGSLGLALTQATADPLAAVNELAGQDALAAAGLGLLVRDDGAALTGVHLPSLLAGGLSGYPGAAWQDRAALMEGVWQREVPDLAGPFLTAHPTASTGPLILNSTSVGTGCRVLVSQVRFPPSHGDSGVSGRQDPACRTGTVPLPATFDLLADYGPQAGQGGAQCLGALSTASAVMLSARFAYVTPSGVVGPCRGLTSQQLVDGGYAESSGLGTLVDLAGSAQSAPDDGETAGGWAGLVREHNVQALTQLLAPTAAGASSTDPVFLAPVVVFLQNHFRSDIAASASKPSNEAMVPIDGKTAGPAQYDTAALLQRAQILTAPDVPCPAGGPEAAATCAAVRDELDGQVPHSVVVVAPDTRPAVTAPLGWVLSRTSRRGLDATMARQAGTTCAQLAEQPPKRQSPDCRAGYGRLADLIHTLQP